MSQFEQISGLRWKQKDDSRIQKMREKKDPEEKINALRDLNRDLYSERMEKDVEADAAYARLLEKVNQ